MKIAQEGDRILVHIVGMFEDGFIFDNTSNSSPYEFKLTDEDLLIGLKQNIIGMAVGETKKIILEPQMAFGNHIPDLVINVDKKHLVYDIEPEQGDIVELNLSSGEVISVEVIQVDGDKVLIDANHPYVDKTLFFEIQLVDILEEE